MGPKKKAGNFPAIVRPWCRGQRVESGVPVKQSAVTVVQNSVGAVTSRPVQNIRGRTQEKNCITG